MNLFLSLGKRKEALVMIIYHHLSFFYGRHAKIRRDNRPLRTYSDMSNGSDWSDISPPVAHHGFWVRVMPFGYFSGLFSQIKG